MKKIALLCLATLAVAAPHRPATKPAPKKVLAPILRWSTPVPTPTPAPVQAIAIYGSSYFASIEPFQARCTDGAAAPTLTTPLGDPSLPSGGFATYAASSSTAAGITFTDVSLSVSGTYHILGGSAGCSGLPLGTFSVQLNGTPVKLSSMSFSFESTYGVSLETNPSKDWVGSAALPNATIGLGTLWILN